MLKNYKTSKSLAALLLLVSLLTPWSVFAATGVPKILNNQGRLMDSNGVLLGGGGTDYCFKFSLYDNATVGAGSKLWPTGAPSTMTSVVKNGVFNVGVGDVSAGGDLLDFNFQDTDTVFLNVDVAAKVGATCAPGDGAESFETLGPRQRVFSSGYAINADTVDGFGAAQNASGNQIPALSGGNLILGGTNPTLSATTTNTLTLQGNSSGDLLFFGVANKITSAGDMTLAGLLTTDRISFVNGTSTNFFAQNVFVSQAFFGGTATSTFNNAGQLTLAGGLNGPLQANAGLVSATSSVGVLYGGTGLSSAPTLGQLLVGNSTGGYTLTGTSSLGLPTSADLNQYLSLSAWYGTTTDALDEGTTNLYFTNARVNSFIDASSTIPKTFSANTYSALQTFTNASSTLFSSSYASSTNASFGSVSIGNLNGVLRATAGAVSTGLVSLATEVSGILAISNGGTGTSTAPTYGRILVGNASGAYDLLATSSLGLLSSADLAGYLTLSAWYSTTTSDIEEGTNLYFTTARATTSFIGNLAATTSVNSITTLNNLSLPATQLTSFGTPFYNFFSATTTDALAEGTSNFYFTTARANTNFANNLAATTTTALAEGSNLYFTTARATTSFVGNLAGTTSVNSITTLNNLTTVSTGLTGILKTTAGVLSTGLVSLASEVSGILGVANGGTGWASFTSGTLLTGNGAGALATTTIASSLQLSGGTLSLNTSNANAWSALQTFSNASSSLFTAYNGFFGELTATSSATLASTTAFGRFITGNIVATSTATSTITGPLSVGIANSSYKVSFVGSTTAPTSATGTAVLAVTNTNSTLSSGTNVLRLNVRTPYATACVTGSTCPRFIEYFAGVPDNADTGGRGVGSLRLSTAGTGITQTSGSADFAEFMLLNSAAAPGDVVSLNSSGEYQKAVAGQSLIGVISENPAFVANANIEGETNAYIVGFAGVVPTTVSAANGTINAGDFIAASTTGGVGVKLLNSGYTLGQALQPFSGGGTGTINVLVFPKYIDASVALEEYGGSGGGVTGYWDLATTTGIVSLASTTYSLVVPRATITNASTTNISATYASSTQGFFGSLSVGSLSGVVRASAGALTTGLVNLATEVSGVLGITSGGTGTTTAPVYGQLLVGNALGGYDLLATSSLGFVTGGDLSQYLTLSAWYGTTTDALDEGTNNLYFTQNRVAGVISGTTTTALTEGLNLYFTTARATTSFVGNLAATTSISSITALPNLSITNSQVSDFNTGVNSFINSSTTIPKTYTANTFTQTQTFGNASTTNISSTYASSTSGFFGSLSIANLTGVLKATAGAVSAGAVNLATEVSGVLGITNGGTGTSTAPTYGRILVGNASGAYDLLATSSLGLLSSADLAGYLTLADYYATTTDGLDEGILNKYFTVERVASVISGTTTDALAEGSTNKYYTTLRFASDLSGTTTTALAEGTNLYFTTARANTNFVSNLSATTSVSSITALPSLSITSSQVSNFNDSANAFVAGSSTIPKTYTSNTFSGTQTFGNASTTNISATYASSTSGFFGSLSVGSLSGVVRASAGALATGLVNLASEVTGILGITNGGTGTSTAPVYGQLLVGNAAGAYDLVATSSLGFVTSGDLSQYLSLSAWYSTTTDALLEGVTNKYFTTDRVASVIAGTTTTALAEGSNLYFTTARATTSFVGNLAATTSVNSITTLNNLSLPATQLTSFGTPFFNFFSATTTDALAEGASNFYFTTARANTNFANNFAATTTTALAEGSNLYFTNNRVASVIAGTTTDALAEGATNQYFTTARANTNFVSNLAATTSVNSITALQNLSINAAQVSDLSGSVNSFVAGSSTIPKTYTANTFTQTQTFGNASTTNISSTYASSTSGFFGSLSVGSLSGVVRASAGALTTGLLNLASEVSGILGVANGGTGWASLQSGAVLYGNGAGAVATTSAGTNGQTLALVGGVPTWVATTTFSGGLSYASGNVTLNTANANTWSALQTFASASSSLLSTSYASSTNLFAGFFIATQATTTNLFAGTVDANTARFGQSATSSFNSTGQLTLAGTPNGPLQANAGVVSATTSVGVVYGGTGLTTAPAQFQMLQGSAGGGYTLIATSSLFANSGQFASWLSDEQGTGFVVFSNSPTFTGTAAFAGLTAANATSSAFFSGSVSGNTATFGGTATTTIRGNTNATSTFAGGVETRALNVTATNATSTFANGVNLSGGCFSINGACVGGTTAVNSVSNADGTLTISPNSGTVVASLNLSNPNVWTGLQRFNNATTTFLESVIHFAQTIQSTSTNALVFKSSLTASAGLTLGSTSTPQMLALNTLNNRVALGTGGSTPVVFVLDTKNTAGDPTGVDGAMYYNSNTSEYRCHSGTVWRTCGGIAASSTGDVQIKNSDGSFTATANFNWSLASNGLTIKATSSAQLSDLLTIASSTGSSMFAFAANGSLKVATTSEPVPASSGINMFATDIAGRSLPHWSALGATSTPFQPAFFGKNIIIFAPQSGTTGTGSLFGATWQSNGTVSHPTLTAGTTTQMHRTRYANVVTTTNQVLGPKVNTADGAMFWRGNSANLGGFFFYTRFVVELYPATTVRLFAGLSSSNTGVVASDTVAGDVIGLWHDTTDGANVLSIVTRNNVTTTKTSITGATLAAGQGYDFYLYAKPNDTQIYYRLDSINTGATVQQGVVSTTLPRNTIFMGPQVQMSNGTANTIVTTVAPSVVRIYAESDY